MDAQTKPTKSPITKNFNVEDSGITARLQHSHNDIIQQGVQITTSNRASTSENKRSTPEQQPSGNIRSFSVVILGAGGTQKSALTLRYMKGYFHEAYDPTIEESYRRKVNLDGETCLLEVLDTAGAEQFVSLNDLYIKAGRGFILVFSLTDSSTLREIESLREQILRIKGDRVPIVLVGTHAEKIEERQITKEELHTRSIAWGVPVYETSVNKNWHVSDPFEDLLRQMRIRYPTQTMSRSRRQQNRTKGTPSETSRGPDQAKYQTSPQESQKCIVL
ncbi:ras-domain-containing protein [Serendipita vermifera]|nr:ras-domain-containing protein [Serendipita vermifera]